MIWFSKKRDGRQYVYSSSTFLMALLPLLALAFAILATIRGCVGG